MKAVAVRRIAMKNALSSLFVKSKFVGKELHTNEREDVHEEQQEHRKICYVDKRVNDRIQKHS